MNRIVVITGATSGIGLLSADLFRKDGDTVITLANVGGENIENFMYFGRSRGDSIGIDSTIYVASEDELKIGEIANVLILDAGEYDLTGKTV